MESVGLWDYWRESGHWPDFCSEPGLPYDCKVEAQGLLEEKNEHEGLAHGGRNLGQVAP
jgi:hypothetical protein